MSKISKAEYDKKRRSSKEAKAKIAKTRRKYKIVCRMVWDNYIKDSGFTECSICGYNKCTQSLGFHHTDLTNKTITIARITREAPTPERLKLFDEEVVKCIYVCSNCHGEIHHSLGR
jgi:hypothetical protein